jgi:hypothetical protein
LTCPVDDEEQTLLRYPHEATREPARELARRARQHDIVVGVQLDVVLPEHRVDLARRSADGCSLTAECNEWLLAHRAERRDAGSRKYNAKLAADFAHGCITAVKSGTRLGRREDDLRVRPTDPRACESASVALDEDAGLQRAGTRKARKCEEVSSGALGQPRPEQKLTDDDVAGPNALLRQERHQPHVRCPEMANPSVRVDEDHALVQAERFGLRALGAAPPIAASRCAASRASRARRPS